MSALFHFTLIFNTKIGTRSYPLITTDFLNQNSTKKVILLYKKLFQLGVANGYLSRMLNAIITHKIVKIKIT